MPVSLAEKIRAILHETGLDQAALAAVLGISHQRVRNLAAGRVQKLEEMEAKALVQQLHIRGHWLVTGEGAIRQTPEEIRLEKSLQLLRDTTAKATTLELEAERQILVRDILYGVAMDNASLLNASIDGFIAKQTGASKEGREASGVQQNFHGNAIGQVASGNIINKGGRKR